MTSLDKNLGDYNANPIDLTVPSNCAGFRLDQTLSKLLPQYSRSRLQQWVNEGLITLDGGSATPKQKVWGGEALRLLPRPDPQQTKFAPEAIPLDIIYEDDTLLVINKSVGLVVHPGSGNWNGTLLNALLQHASQLADLPRAGIVHRLDKDTSGLLVVAKSLTAQTSLVRQLQARSVKRQYLALVHGQSPEAGTIEAPLGRHPVARVKIAVVASGKPARTHFHILERLPGASLLECSLDTGRTHQIRVHMQSIGHPLVGDPVYGTKPKVNLPPSVRETLIAFPRQALHAARLSLNHPQRDEMLSWEIPLPADFSNLLHTLRNLP